MSAFFESMKKFFVVNTYPQLGRTSLSYNLTNAPKFRI